MTRAVPGVVFVPEKLGVLQLFDELGICTAHRVVQADVPLWTEMAGWVGWGG